MQDVGASGGRHPLSLLEVTVAETWGWGADRMLPLPDGEEVGVYGRANGSPASHLQPLSGLWSTTALPLACTTVFSLAQS